MKKYIVFVISMFFLFMVHSCQKGSYTEVKQAAYVVGNGQDKSLNLENDLIELFQVRSASQVDQDKRIKVSLSERFLDEYNAKYSTEYKLLPKELYTIADFNTVIPKGSTVATSVPINFKALPVELGKSGEVYALPLTIESSDIKIMETGADFLYILRPTPYADVPILKRGNGMKFNLKEERITVNDYTVEFLVHIDNLRQGYNNQILFNADDGAGSEIFTRFAADGAAGKFDKFQLKNQGKNYDANFSFKNNTWYHIACVNNNTTGKMYLYVNGVLDSQFDNARMPSTISSSSSRGVRFGGEAENDSYFRSNIRTSEIRFWKVARTATQIKNSMYGVNPKSEGLIAYWKANEGSGNKIIDVSGNGNDGVLVGRPESPSTGFWLLNQKVKVD